MLWLLVIFLGLQTLQGEQWSKYLNKSSLTWSRSQISLFSLFSLHMISFSAANLAFFHLLILNPSGAHKSIQALVESPLTTLKWERHSDKMKIFRGNIQEQQELLRASFDPSSVLRCGRRGNLLF